MKILHPNRAGVLSISKRRCIGLLAVAIGLGTRTSMLRAADVVPAAAAQVQTGAGPQAPLERKSDPSPAAPSRPATEERERLAQAEPAADEGPASVAAYPAPVSASQLVPQLKTIEITGTHILAPNLISDSPITTMNAAQIQDQGTTDIETLLSQLPPTLLVTETDKEIRVSLRRQK
ncbi:MAG TPA: hypothetical protein VNE82_07775 [Candidatus Binataceae bacterium]|nr:hypothetical protein [Candidatus Binataceae bacterium]